MTLPAEHDRLYLFWRGADYSQDYETRTAGGQWSAAHELIAQPHERPYVKYDTNGRDTIAMAFTNGHPRETLTSIYFAEYRDGWLRGASGRRIKRLGSGPIAPVPGDLVYNGATTHVSSWVWDVAIAPDGRPRDPVRDVPDEAATTSTGTRPGPATTGSRTSSPSPARRSARRSIEFEYSGGMALDHSDPSIVYLSRKVATGWRSSGGRRRTGGTAGVTRSSCPPRAPRTCGRLCRAAAGRSSFCGCAATTAHTRPTGRGSRSACTQWTVKSALRISSSAYVGQ